MTTDSFNYWGVASLVTGLLGLLVSAAWWGGDGLWSLGLALLGLLLSLIQTARQPSVPAGIGMVTSVIALVLYLLTIAR